MKIIQLISVLVCSYLVALTGSANNFRLPDGKFQLLASECLNMANEKGIRQMSYKNADGVGLEISGGYSGVEAGIGFNIPRSGLNKSSAPGHGICCAFNQAGKILEVRQVIKGNDECQALVRSNKSTTKDLLRMVFMTPAQKTAELERLATKYIGAGLWWCTGPEDACHFDWWYIEP
jgi:hypothetical protein